jgi:energy-coupling factor transporter ATP-binding protein EcfA2
MHGLIPNLFHGNQDGYVIVDGMDTRSHPVGQFAGKVGLILQNPVNQLSGMCNTVFEEVAWGLENLGVAPRKMPTRITKVLADVGLNDYHIRNPFSLSSGQQQRLAIASILVLEPTILLLDEPTSMLDPMGSRAIQEIIHQQVQKGKTVVVASHDLEWLANSADRIIALDEGRVVLDGSPELVLTSSLLDTIGIGRLSITLAAELGLVHELWQKNLPLPITLEQAAAGFGMTLDSKGQPE